MASDQTHKLPTDSNMSEHSEKQSASQVGPNPPVVVAEPGSFVSMGGSAKFEVSPRTRITLDLTPEAAQALNELMSRTGIPPPASSGKRLDFTSLPKKQIGRERRSG